MSCAVSNRAKQSGFWWNPRGVLHSNSQTVHARWSAPGDDPEANPGRRHRSAAHPGWRRGAASGSSRPAGLAVKRYADH